MKIMRFKAEQPSIGDCFYGARLMQYIPSLKPVW